MQALVCFWSAILNLVRNSLGGHDLFAFSISDVLLGHNHRRMPKLISGLQDITTGFRLIGTRLGAQVAHLKLCCTTHAPVMKTRTRPVRVFIDQN